jgi:hypothetical protein
LEELKVRWYHDTAILFELVKQMVARETAFLSMTKKGTHRCLKIHKVEFLRRNFDRYRFFEPEYCYNIYSSVSQYEGMPMMSFRQDKKHEEMAMFNLNAEKHIIGYDFVLDIDNKDLDIAYSQTKRIKELFDIYRVPYSLKFSGTKGFHIVVGYHDLPISIKAMAFQEMKELFRLFASELKIYQGLDSIDLGIYDLRRILKTPYSVVYPFYYVSLPLDDAQFKNFKLKLCFLPEIMGNTEAFRNRGLVKRDGDKEGLIRLMRDTAAKRKATRDLFNLLKIKKEFLLDRVGL